MLIISVSEIQPLDVTPRWT